MVVLWDIESMIFSAFCISNRLQAAKHYSQHIFLGGTWFVSDRDIILILFEGLTIILLEMVLLDFLNALEEYIMIF